MDGYHPMTENARSRVSCQDGALAKGFGMVESDNNMALSAQCELYGG